MNTMNIASVDLNLLKVFEALHEESNASRAALRLGGTQSAVSAALVIQQGMNRYNSFPPRYYLLLAGLECALILLMFGFSALHLRRLVGAVLRQSVISQIREAG